MPWLGTTFRTFIGSILRQNRISLGGHGSFILGESSFYGLFFSRFGLSGF
jgi:hypothetical protein